MRLKFLLSQYAKRLTDTHLNASCFKKCSFQRKTRSTHLLKWFPNNGARRIKAIHNPFMYYFLILRALSDQNESGNALIRFWSSFERIADYQKWEDIMRMNSKKYVIYFSVVICAFLAVNEPAKATCLSAEKKGISSRENIFGGYDYNNGMSSRRNIFGGYDCSDGTSSRKNIFDGQDYSNGVSSRKNIMGGQDYNNGKSSRKNTFGGQDYNDGVSSRKNIFGGYDYQ